MCGVRCAGVEMKKLTPIEERFAFAVVTSRSPMNALMQAKPGRKRGSYLAAEAEAMMTRPHVAARIEELRKQFMERLNLSATTILQEWYDIAFADPNELIQHRRLCCRNCYGKNNGYQWLDETEWQEAAHAATLRNAQRRSAGMGDAEMEPEPSRAGGFGYDRLKLPKDSCPICQGEGVGEVFVADTTKLTGRASKLYAGIKQTKFGIEILMRDQDAALANLARAFGVIPTGTPKGGNDGGGDRAALFEEIRELLPN